MPVKERKYIAEAANDVRIIAFRVEEHRQGCHNPAFRSVRQVLARRSFWCLNQVSDHDLKLSWCAMQKDRKRIERQLEVAKQNVATCEKQLESAGVTGKARAKDTKWRHLNADYRQIKRRLLAVVAIEEREAAAIARKAEKQNAETVEA